MFRVVLAQTVRKVQAYSVWPRGLVKGVLSS
jgi:hypothetical protein